MGCRVLSVHMCALTPLSPPSSATSGLCRARRTTWSTSGTCRPRRLYRSFRATQVSSASVPLPSCAWCPGKPDPARVGTLGHLLRRLSSPAGDWGTLPVVGLLSGGWSGPGSRRLRPHPEATAFNLFFLSAGLPGPKVHAGAVACPAWRWCRERGRPPSTPAALAPLRGSALQAAALPPCSAESGVEPFENQIRVTPSSVRRQLCPGAGPDPGGRHRPSASIVGLLLLLLCCAGRTLRGSFEATQAREKILGFILFKSYKRINRTDPKWQLAASAVPALVDSQSWPLGAPWGPALVQGGSPGLWSRCRGRSADTVRPTAAPPAVPPAHAAPQPPGWVLGWVPLLSSARALGSVC